MTHVPHDEPPEDRSSESDDFLPATGGSRRDRIREIPLFPLNVVLFPFMVLRLHIFEERYKEMINRCIDEQIPFGIVLVRGVDETTHRLQTALVGCTARIAQVERLADGRMNIEVVGEQRFRILDTHEEHSYRSALVERLEDEPYDEEPVLPLAAEVHEHLTEFLIRSLALVGQNNVEFELPTEPTQLSFISACVLPLENEARQTLLAETEIMTRLSTEREALIQEVQRLQQAEQAQETIWKQLDFDAFQPYLCQN